MLAADCASGVTQAGMPLASRQWWLIYKHCMPQQEINVFACWHKAATCMWLQATSLHEEWVSEKSQRIQLTERLVKQSARLSDQIMLNEANANRIRWLLLNCTLSWA